MDGSAMVVLWSTAAVTLLAVLGVLVLLSRSDSGTSEQVGPSPPGHGHGRLGTLSSAVSDPPDLETVDRHAEASIGPAPYRAARLVAWTVNRCAEEDEEMGDESPS